MLTSWKKKYYEREEEGGRMKATIQNTLGLINISVRDQHELASNLKHNINSIIKFFVKNHICHFKFDKESFTTVIGP